MNFINWLLNNQTEIIGFTLTIIYLILSVKENILLWPFGILSSLIYVVIFYSSRLYADMGLYIYYVAFSFYGWYNWNRKIPENSEFQKIDTKIKNTSLRTWSNLFISTTFIFIFIVFILKNYSDSDLPYWDALTTSFSITATWMLSQKLIEHWLLWIFIDLTSLGIYIYKELYITTLLFFIYTIMAIIGFVQWKKKWKTDIKLIINE